MTKPTKFQILVCSYDLEKPEKCLFTEYSQLQVSFMSVKTDQNEFLMFLACSCSYPKGGGGGGGGGGYSDNFTHT